MTQRLCGRPRHPLEALRSAVEAAQTQGAEYVCVWREDGDFNWNMGDSRWSCEVLADEPHLTWKLLEPEELVDEDEARAIITAHDLASASYITHELVHRWLGQTAAVEGEVEYILTTPAWDDFVAALGDGNA